MLSGLTQPQLPHEHRPKSVNVDSPQNGQLSFQEKLKMFGGADKRKRVKRQSAALCQARIDEIDRMRNKLQSKSSRRSMDSVGSADSDCCGGDGDADSVQSISELSTEETVEYDLDDLESLHFEKPKRSRRGSLCTPAFADEWSAGTVKKTEVEMLREMRRLSLCSLQNIQIG